MHTDDATGALPSMTASSEGRAPAASSPPVSVIIVAHDSGEDLARCANSVLAQPEACELIVVDNASGDASLLQLPADARMRLLLNPDNRGFARACNQGAELARGELLLFLNPDCVLPGGALAALLQAMRARPDLGVLGAQLLDADGSPQAASHRADPSPWRAVRHALGLSGLDGTARVVRAPAPHGHGDAGKRAPRVAGTSAPGEAGAGTTTSVDAAVGADAITEADAVSGALMLVPRDVFADVDGFDDGYVLHCEDLDLCRRIRARGHPVGFAPAVRVPHAKGTSSRRRPAWVEWQKHRGMWRYFEKFDAVATPVPARVLLWLGLWAHFLLAAPRAWLRTRRRS